jgi:hypothetical protein
MKHSFSFLAILVLIIKFNFVQAQINVVKPNGGETWYSFSMDSVKWIGSAMNVNIYLSLDNQVTWNLIAGSVASGPSGGYYTMFIPYANSNTCFIKVEDAANPANVDVSNSAFTIMPSQITITSPNGGEDWAVGSAQTITWSTSGVVHSVDLFYSTDGGASWNVIQTNVPNIGSYAWTVPNDPSTTCRVRVLDFMIPVIGDTSNANFTISTPLNISTPLYSQAINAYPNPTMDNITLEVPNAAAYQIQIVDLTGKTMYSATHKVENTYLQLNMQNLPKGMYLIQLSDDKGNRLTKKVEKL